MQATKSTTASRRRARLVAVARGLRAFFAFIFVSPALTMALVVVLAALFGALYALHLGQNIDYDQRNYHFESAYEFLQGRLTVDAAPSGLLHSFFNPLPYLPFYEMARHWRTTQVIATLGALHGLNLAIVFAIAMRLTPPGERPFRILLAALATVFSGASAMALSEFGGSTTDVLLSPLILLGVLALIVAAETEGFVLALGVVAFGAALVGLAVGLKLTHAIYALGLAAACLFGWRSWRERLLGVLVAGFAGACGVLAAGGFWFARMWRLFASPTFPYYDAVFKSPAIDPTTDLHGFSFYDTRFLPASLTEALILPFRWMGFNRTTAELRFRDMRFGFIIALALACLAVWLWRRRRGFAIKWVSGAEARLIAVCVVSYVVWLNLFGIQRYLVGVEFLLGPIALILLRPLFSGFRLVAAAAVLAIVAAATVSPPDWGHVRPQKHWFAVRLPPSLQTPAIVLAPPTTSFIGPYLPPESVMIGFSDVAPLQRGGKGLINEALASALTRGLPVVLLAAEPLKIEQRRDLGQYGLQFVGKCEKIANVAGPLAACPMSPSPPNAMAAPALFGGETMELGSSLQGVALLDGWNIDSSWANIGPDTIPRLQMRGDASLLGGPAKLTIRLAGLGDLNPEDELEVMAGGQIVGSWPVARLGSELNVCLTEGLLKSADSLEIAFVDRPADKASARLGAIGLASLTAAAGGCPKP